MPDGLQECALLNGRNGKRLYQPEHELVQSTLAPAFQEDIFIPFTLNRSQ